MRPTESRDLPNLIVFGGTFDPPHTGHVDMLAAALARFPHARGLVLPAPQPAGAGGRHKRPHADFSDRLALCRAAFLSRAADDAARIEVSDLEDSLPSPNYTVATLAAVAAAYPRRSLGLLLGQDQLASFDEWREPRRILELTALIVVARADDEADRAKESLTHEAVALAKRLGVAARWEAPGVLALAGIPHHVYTLDRPPHPAASRTIRAVLGQGQEAPAGWLPQPVLFEIKERGLYGA
jgi:nicotinate-nucleotide adenylyltransferase